MMKSRRELIISAIGVSSVAAVLPKQWTKPIIYSVVLPAHAQASCSGFTTTVVNESISITVTTTEIQGPIVVARSNSNAFTGEELSDLGAACGIGQTLNVEVQFSGQIDGANNQITGDLVIVQTCGGQLVCEQVSTFVVDQSPVNTGVDIGVYVGTVTGTLRCCDDFF